MEQLLTSHAFFLFFFSRVKRFFSCCLTALGSDRCLKLKDLLSEETRTWNTEYTRDAMLHFSEIRLQELPQPSHIMSGQITTLHLPRFPFRLSPARYSSPSAELLLTELCALCTNEAAFSSEWMILQFDKLVNLLGSPSNAKCCVSSGCSPLDSARCWELMAEQQAWTRPSARGAPTSSTRAMSACNVCMFPSRVFAEAWWDIFKRMVTWDILSC